jgi:hypothetical protein
MVAINFKKHFAILVEKGLKVQTIRQNTKAYTGCKLQLYYGQRTKQCRKLMDAICTSVRSIVLVSNCVSLPSGWLAVEDMDAFARKDGFIDYAEMWKFFEPRADEGGCFDGYLIEWRAG